MHPRYGTPWVSLVVSSAIYSVCILGPFQSLVAVDVTIYAAALLLQFAALVVLRIKRPDMERPYRIPGGWFGSVPVVALPSAARSWSSSRTAGGVPLAACSDPWASDQLAFLNSQDYIAPDLLRTFAVSAGSTAAVQVDTGNAAARELLPAELLDNAAVFPPDDVLDRLVFTADLGADEALYDEAWERVLEA